MGSLQRLARPVSFDWLSCDSKQTLWKECGVTRSKHVDFNIASEDGVNYLLSELEYLSLIKMFSFV
jgi:hypothetical protein